MMGLFSRKKRPNVDKQEKSDLVDTAAVNIPSSTVWQSIRWAPILIGAFFLLLSIGLEHPNLLGSAYAPPAEGESYSIIFEKKMALLFIAEVGYAFIIAGIVANFLEINARREQVEFFRQTQESIKRSVFEATYRIKHSEEYVKSVIGNCFESPLVRERYKISYEIYPLPKEFVEKHNIDGSSYVLVNAAISYLARNMGPDRSNFPTGYGIPLLAGPFRELAGLKELRVGNKTYSGDQIDQFIDQAPHHESGVGREDNATEKNYCFDVPTDAGDFTEVRLELSLVKEISDNDAFGFRRPTVGCTINIVNHTEQKLVFGVTPRTSAVLKEVRVSESTGEWEIIGPILPFDSAVIWWRKPDFEHKYDATKKLPVQTGATDSALAAPDATET